MLSLPAQKFEEVIAFCKRGYPSEVCGLLLGKTKKVEQIFPARNLNQERASDRYELDPADFKAADESARRQCLEIIGFYHSHPDHPPDASQTDTERAWEGYCYLIVSVYKGKVEKIKCWRLNGDRMTEEKLEVTNG
ncbi:MAG: M67 family metallopeptidase [Deltaproteobacteria bacterium]|nr:M67 family metallopeptidase [Deltaproteobacteria bacterium]